MKRIRGLYFNKVGFIALTLSVLLSWASPSQAELYILDTQASELMWLEKKLNGSHNGALSLKSGKLNLEDHKITGGDFEINMDSITVLDIEDSEKNAKLVGHLKSDDFFSVAKHPSARFMITKVEEKTPQQVEVTGNLTIKGITRAVTIPAQITQQGDVLQAKGAVELDRTQWDVRYGSGKFFKGLGDRLIKDEFELKLNLIAKKSRS